MTDAERQQLLQSLYAPFDPSLIKQREGGGGKVFDYVDTYTVIDRLNKATGNDWSSEIISMEFRPWGSKMLAVAQVRLLIEGLGHRDGIGVQVLMDGMAEDLVKGAQSDALKNAAAKFGVALALYGPDPVLSEAERVQMAQKSSVNGMPNPMPIGGQPQRQPSMASQQQGRAIYAKWMGLFNNNSGLREYVLGMTGGREADTRKITFQEAKDILDDLKAKEEAVPEEAWS